MGKFYHRILNRISIVKVVWYLWSLKVWNFSVKLILIISKQFFFNYNSTWLNELQFWIVIFKSSGNKFLWKFSWITIRNFFRKFILNNIVLQKQILYKKNISEELWIIAYKRFIRNPPLESSDKRTFKVSDHSQKFLSDIPHVMRYSS